MHTVWQDLRYAFRTLGKNPGFTAIAVLTLGLGISINSTMFAMVSGYLLRRPPVRDADRVLVVSSVNPAAVFMPDAYPVSAPNYVAWRDGNHVFSEVTAADHYRNVSLTVGGQAEALRSAAVSANYFALLGANPELGQTFAEGQDQPGHDHVVVLSHALWARRFASDPGVVGSTVRLNRENYVVLGVMPANFMLMGYTEQLWTPRTLSATDTAAAARNDRSLQLLGRLKPGATLAQAQTEFKTLASRAQSEFPEVEKGWGVSVRTLPDFLVYGFGIRTGLAIVMTTVGFVLLIACGNVAGLLLTRAAGRQKELAVRISLGAGRLDIVRQLLTEGLVIAVLGGTVGLLLATWGVKVVRANMQFNEAVAAVPISLDRNVLWFTLGVSMVSALLCGLAPALKASRTDVNRNLKDDSRGSTSGPAHNRLRTIMITGEIALALFLVIGTGLLVRGIFVLEHQNLGFQPDHLLTAAVTLDSARYKDAPQQALFLKEVTARAQTIPGIEDVAATSDLPATGPNTVTFHIEGKTESPSTNQPLSALDEVVSSDYFRAAGITLLRGRTFTEMDDSAATRVVVVSQQFVQRFLHDQEPLGKRVQLDVSGEKPVWNEIVGVVSDVKTYSQATRSDPLVYEPFLQRPVAGFALMLQTSRDPNEVAPDLRNAVAQVDAELPLDRVMSMPAVIQRQRLGDVFFSRMLGVFAALALILSAVGIYGLIASSVAHRTHEIGIRMALGAERSDVLRIVLWQGLKMTVIGAVIGLLLALPLPKLFESLFFDLHFAEPALYFIVPVAIIAVSMLATYIPARRATRVDPMVALRYE
jgi:putative ABC transport system permease protein